MRSDIDRFGCNDEYADVECYSCGNSTNKGRCSCGYIN